MPPPKKKKTQHKDILRKCSVKSQCINMKSVLSFIFSYCLSLVSGGPEPISGCKVGVFTSNPSQGTMRTHIHTLIHTYWQFSAVCPPPVCTCMFLGHWEESEELWTQGEHTKLHTDSKLNSGSILGPWICEEGTYEKLIEISYIYT